MIAMFFKRNGGKIFGVQFNSKEQAAIDAEIRRQLIEDSRMHEIESDCSILWMLHVHFGFGPGRLRKAWELFYEQARELEKHYEMSAGDGSWLCQKMLEDYGCDVAAWYKELEDKQK